MSSNFSGNRMWPRDQGDHILEYEPPFDTTAGHAGLPSHSDLPPQQMSKSRWLLTQLHRCTSVDAECPHGHLAVDPRPHLFYLTQRGKPTLKSTARGPFECECWRWVEVSQADLKELVKAVKANTAAIKALSAAVNHTDRNVDAVMAQVKASK